jgi:hypothetical protein
MDVHVKAAIISGVRRREIDVVTAQEDGTTRLDDTLLFDRATALARVRFSQDDDLLAIAGDARNRAHSSQGLSMGINWRRLLASLCWILR